ncbi:MAG: signal peptide peptidase SppA [Nitrospirota bacterium]|nr:signal peptide peptidase SppA [Nitrospirota bacterium]MDH5775407.1 signal peptide peptidase SppA [Nitrospirota bacterium]
MGKRLIGVLFFFLILGGCIHVDLFSGGERALQETTISGEGSEKILLIDISGTLTTSKDDGIFSEPSLPARLKEELTKAEKDDHIKAIILRINTPGGTVTSSDILYHELQTFKEKRNVPIISSIMDMGTSGGYYVAMASDYILAHPSTITGSIGVIMLTLNGQGLLEKIGIQPTAIVSGPKKAMGSPFRAMNDEERAIFQDVIDRLYARFLTVVEQGRPNLTPARIRQLADGRIYTADVAKSEGLIDAIGYLDDAVEQAKKRAKLGDAQVVTYTRNSRETHQNVYSHFDPPTVGPIGFPQINTNSMLGVLQGGTPHMMYMWIP